MTKLVWGNPADRYFEIGADRVVLFPTKDLGVAWNGVVAVETDTAGGDATPYYIDGVKYRNVPSVEEFGATLTAYTYPNEFLTLDGFGGSTNGLYYDNQDRQEFDLAYRTLIGNAVEGVDYGYKIHLVYNILASPSEIPYSTLSDDMEPILFSWELSTTPIVIPGWKPTAHVVLDSREVPEHILINIEELLYGTSISDPRMPTLEEIIEEIENPRERLQAQLNSNTGLNPLLLEEPADLSGRLLEGLYRIVDGSRFIPADF